MQSTLAMPAATEFLPLVPELVLVGAAFALLMLDLFLSEKQRVLTHALAIASKTRRTLWRMARLPTMNAPIVPATSSAGNCSVANSASLSTHSGDDADALSHRNSEVSNGSMAGILSEDPATIPPLH